MRAVAFFKREIFKSLQMRLVFIITVFMLLPVLYFLNYNFSTAEHLLQEKTSNLILDSLQLIAKVNLPALLQHSAGKEKGYLLTDVDNTRFVVNHYSLNRFGWTLVSIIPYSEMIKEISSLKQRIFSLNLFSSFFLFTVAVVFILYLTNPLKTLVERIKRMKIGEHYIKWPEGDFPDWFFTPSRFCSQSCWPLRIGICCRVFPILNSTGWPTS